MRLFDERGNRVGLYEVCKWIAETYPPDVCQGRKNIIVKFRRLAEKILALKEKNK